MREDTKAARRTAALSLFTFLALFFSASSTLAATVTNERPLLFSFDGSDIPAGALTQIEPIAVDESTGTVYATNQAGPGHGPGPFDDERVVCKFDAEGNAQNFSALGKACLDGSETPGGAFGTEGFFGEGSFNVDLDVDNSAVNPGRIYVSEEAGPIHAFAPSGAYLWTLPISTVQPCGIAVDREGHLWVGNGNGNGEAGTKALEFAATGSPPAQIGSLALTQGTKRPCRLAIDNSGKGLYVRLDSGSVVDRYVEGSYDSTLGDDGSQVFGVTVDQSKATGHVFLTRRSGFAEFEPCSVPGCVLGEVPGSPFGNELLGSVRSVAYNPSKDWVYVSDRATETIKAFGPVTSGTAPDVTSKPTTAVAQHTATATATINPLGLNNSYHFEWAKGGSVVRHLEVKAGSGTFKATSNGPSPQSTAPLPFDVSTTVLQEALEGLAAIGPGNVSVSGTPATEETTLGEYDIAFVGALAKEGTIPLSASNIDLAGYIGGSAGVSVATKTPHPDWATASSSPEQSIEPTDSVSHEVSLPITGLTGNTTYSVRLVGVNTDNHLRAVSVFDSFTTTGPPPPAVTIDSIAPITTTSAHVAATIDPHEDPTTWKVQKSTDPSCKVGFVDEPTQSIPSPGSGTVAVTWDLTGLLPAQTYCVRVVATNSGGPASAEKTIQTLAVAPTDVKTAFAAPRTDTTARINGRVNPQGEADLTYRFEWSEDGTNWNVLPNRLSTIDSRDQIVVADELSELKPATTYHYRLAFASNSGGPAAALPAPEKTFTTRSSAEFAQPGSCPNEDVRSAQHSTHLPDCRGIELINSPDKGNQNVFAQGPRAGGPALSASGDEVLWEVTAGVPGGPNGTLNAFLAQREGAGWASHPLAPPAEEQLEGGELTYTLSLATPDLESYIFNAKRSTGVSSPEPPSVVRVRGDRSQELLKRYEVQPVNASYENLIDSSDDGSHVIFPDNKTGQLEDIGDPEEEPELISLMPNGSPSACGLETDAADVSFSGPGSKGYHWIATTDASRVYFLVPPNANCNGTYGLYVRNREAAKTTLIDAGSSGKAPVVIRATPDGRAAYFLTRSKLDGADKNTNTDVYRWEEKAGKSSCLTCVVADANVSGEGVLISDDFSHVYFQSPNKLVAGLGRQGGVNLYVLAGGGLDFIGDVGGEVLGSPKYPQLSADGDVLLFRTLATPALSADQMAPQCAQPSGLNPGKCEELYLYDDRDGGLECLSCKPDGTTTNSFGTPFAGSGFDFRLSADGSTAVFATPETLMGSDVNRDTDIYRWRGGALGLITDGVTDFPVGFTAPQVLAVGENGRDILFAIVPPGGSLTGFERDELLNLYDARIDGGFAPPAAPVHCAEDSCQGPLQAPPSAQQPASKSFSGRGNELKAHKRRSCARKRGQARQRCLKKRHRQKAQRKHKASANANQRRAK